VQQIGRFSQAVEIDMGHYSALAGACARFASTCRRINDEVVHQRENPHLKSFPPTLSSKLILPSNERRKASDPRLVFGAIATGESLSTLERDSCLNKIPFSNVDVPHSD
jgi:hypothetical protein